jgi:hypothetical protein
MAQETTVPAIERQVTSAPHGHVLTNAGVWSPDGEWIAFDIRSGREGAVFDGTRIEQVHARTGEVRTLYESRDGACCGVVTCSPVDDRVVFLLGPEHPAPGWSYAAWHRRGVLVSAARPGDAAALDACDVAPPFTPGALRGGSHVHVFGGDGQWVGFTYEDHVLAQFPPGPGRDRNQRNVGVSVLGRPVRVPGTHPRNRDGTAFSVLATRTVNDPRPGSDEISRAFEEAWVGTDGYRRPDGTRQRRALAFQGLVRSASGDDLPEVFVCDLPDDVTVPGDGPLEGTATRRPAPPQGAVQRRLTFTADRRHPGIRGPRHWLRSSPDGSRIAFLMKDEGGVVQLWTVSPTGGEPRPLTRNPRDVASSFTWSPDGRRIAHVMDNSVFVTDAETGRSERLTARSSDAEAPLPLACVFSPDGRSIAILRPVAAGGAVHNQVFVVEGVR